MSTVAYLRVACAIVLVAGALACKNPKRCDGNPGNNCDYTWDAPDTNACTSNDQCSGATPVCDVTGSKQCVQCVAPDQTSACTGTTPICGDDHTCQACTMHAQCASNACLPDGSCGAEASIAYVDPAGTDNDACTKMTPCTKVAKALATNRPYVKFHGTTSEQVTINNQNVTLLADAGAKLTYTAGPGIVLKIDGSSVVSIYDLEIADALGTTGTGISLQNGNTATVTLHRVKVTGNGGTGITASGGTLTISQSTVSGNAGGGVSASGGTLTISQSTISGNAGGGVSASGGTLTISQSTISGNAGGGVSITSAQFDLSNNVIVKNGSVTSSFGGVLITQANTGTRRFAFNTVSANGGMTGSVTGVTCVLVNQPVTFANNIVYANQVSGGGTQVGGGGMCTHTYSDIGPDTVAGAGNINMDPMFVNPTQSDFHIASASPCKDAADPAATLDVDIDGDARPQGSQRDMGADEYR